MDRRIDSKPADEAETLTLDTNPLHPTQDGLKEDEQSAPGTHLNGRLVKHPKRDAIYVVEKGYRRLIPDPKTYRSLFRPNVIVVPLDDIDKIQEGTALPSGAMLVKPDDSGRIYLIDSGAKRHIVNQATMELYGFDWSKVRSIPAIVLDLVYTGSEIT